MPLLKWLNPVNVLRLLDRLDKMLKRYEPDPKDPRYNHPAFWK